MIEVFVWEFQGVNEAWGHASMYVHGGKPSGSVYISWWPRGAGRQQKVPGVGFLADLYSVDAIVGRTYADDLKGEDNRKPQRVTLNGLDETAIKKWWHDLIHSADTTWSSLGQNCATTVAKALKAGGGDDVTTGFRGWWDSWNVVWTPNDALKYARAIERGLITRTKAGP